MINISKPYFTICIPAYNRAYKIKRCLDSLISQTYQSFEVVLVDDGSTDNTEEVVSDYKRVLNLKYIKKQNGGKHTALNVGIKNADDTELFMIVDSDDWLCDDALETFKKLWEGISLDARPQYCGIMARCADQNNRFIGEVFPVSPYVTDYVMFHFGGKVYRDCNECLRTSIIKQYEYPEPSGTKFVPEYYVFDQIGLKYLLKCVNQVTQHKEYLKDGITNNYTTFFKSNCVGYSYGLVCRIERVFTNYEGRLSYRKKIMTWYEYWYACYYDKSNYGDRVSRITICGHIARIRFLLKRVLMKIKIKKEK